MTLDRSFTPSEGVLALLRNLVFFTPLLLNAAAQDGNTVAELLRRLDSDDVNQRAEAQEALVSRGEAIVEGLEKARAGVTPEVAARILDVLERIRWYEHVAWAHEHSIDIRSGRLLWSVSKPDASLEVQCAVVERDVMVCFPDGRLERRSLRNGDLVWMAEAGPDESRRYWDKSWAADLWIGGDIVLRITKSDLHGNDTRTGKELWTTPQDLNGPKSPRRDAIFGEKSFLISMNDKTHVYELAGGKRIWTLDEYASDGVFLPGGDVVLVTRKGIRRFQGADGKLVWKIERSSQYQDRKLILAGPWLLAGSDGDLEQCTTMFDSGTGKEIWKTTQGYPIGATSSKNAKHVFVAVHGRGKGNGALLDVDVTEKKAIWNEKLEQEGVTLRLEGERLLVCEFTPHACDVGLACLRANDGSQLWKAQVSGIRVPHSRYYQYADLEVRQGHIVVNGQAAAGDFLETFSLKDGTAVSKWRSP